MAWAAFFPAELSAILTTTHYSPPALVSPHDLILLINPIGGCADFVVLIK